MSPLWAQIPTSQFPLTWSPVVRLEATSLVVKSWLYALLAMLLW